MVYERSPAYVPGQTAPYKISRSKIENFIRCPRCFWLEARLKIKQPSSPPFLINSAIDELLKTEFDIYRAKGEKHPWQIDFRVDAKPFKHEHMERWRDALRRGVQVLHEPTNLLVTGGVDDVWENSKGELIVVDYKATAKTKEITDLEDSKWHDSYRRQMEVYQWLLRGEGYKVSDTGYFVYANGIAKADGFFNKVEFRTNVFPYIGNDNWVEPTLLKIKETLEDDIPKESADCEFCAYARARTELTLGALQKTARK